VPGARGWSEHDELGLTCVHGTVDDHSRLEIYNILQIKELIDGNDIDENCGNYPTGTARDVVEVEAPSVCAQVRS
jgi:hypothetical protein